MPLLLAVVPGQVGRAARPASTGHAPLPLAAARTPALPLRGVTLDLMDDLPAILAAISAHRTVPTVRVVFDPARSPVDYAAAIRALRPSAWIMGELLDSTAMRGTTVAQVRARARRFTAALGGSVDIWEIGNEVNGAWVGRNPAEINAKVAAAFDAVGGEAQARTALTLNYWSGPGCYARPWEATLEFARAMPARVRAGVNFVFLSTYETACDPPQHPTAQDMATMLASLGQIFPRARLGIGEVGAQGIADGLPADPTLAEKRRLARRYYGMNAELARRVGPRFAGGWFWWYYREDAVPKDSPASLWPTLDGLLSAL